MDILLFGLFEFFNDMTFVLKIFALIAILSFLNQNIQNKLIKMVLAIFMIYIVLIQNWATLGLAWMIYTILGLGISGMLTDYFFMNPGHGEEEQQTQMMNQQQNNQPEMDMNDYKELLKRHRR